MGIGRAGETSAMGLGRAITVGALAWTIASAPQAEEPDLTTPLASTLTALHEVLPGAYLCLDSAVYLVDDGEQDVAGLGETALRACQPDVQQLTARYLATLARRQRVRVAADMAKDVGRMAFQMAYAARNGPRRDHQVGADDGVLEPDEAAGPPELEAPDDVCLETNMALSPDGRYALVWDGYSIPMNGGVVASGNAEVLDLDCALARGKDCQAVRLDPGATMEPLGWSADSRALYIVHRKGGGAAMNPSVAGPSRITRYTVQPDEPVWVRRDGEAMAAIPPEAAIWMGGPLQPGSVEEIAGSLHASLAQVSSARPTGSLLQGFGFRSSGGVYALFSDADDASTHAFLGGPGVDPIRLPPLEMLEDPSLGKTEGGEVVLTSLGVWRPVGGSAGRERTSMAGFYSRPVTWSDSGALAGTFGERWLRLQSDDPTSRRLTRAVFELLDQNPRAAIRGLSVNRSGRAMLNIADDQGRSTSYLLDVTTGRSMSYRCAPFDEPLSSSGITFLGKASETPATLTTVISLGTAERPLFGQLLTSPTGPGRSLAVVYRGGPLSSLAFPFNRDTVEHYRSLGFDVLVVEYSGTVGAGLEITERLARSGGPGLEADAERVRRYVAASPYAFRVLHAESFGGVMALADPRRDAAVYQARVMLVPWTRWRRPGDWVSERLGTQISTASMVSFQTMAFGREGARGDLRRWINRKRQAWTPIIPTFAYYAPKDVQISSDDLAGVKSDKLHIVVAPKTTHGMIGMDESVWASIKGNLAAADHAG